MSSYQEYSQNNSIFIHGADHNQSITATHEPAPITAIEAQQFSLGQSLLASAARDLNDLRVLELQDALAKETRRNGQLEERLANAADPSDVKASSSQFYIQNVVVVPPPPQDTTHLHMERWIPLINTLTGSVYQPTDAWTPASVQQTISQCQSVLYQLKASNDRLTSAVSKKNAEIKLLRADLETRDAAIQERDAGMDYLKSLQAPYCWINNSHNTVFDSTPMHTDS